MTRTTLHLGPELSLPAYDAQTNTVVVYGGRGTGKTTLASVLAEELALCGLKFSIVDPVGVWWGLAYSADGKGPGVEVLRIGGGRKPDIEIVPSTQAAEACADLVVEEDVSTVIDISRHANGTMWTKGEKLRFVRDYCTRLYMRQGERRRPLMQIIDEAARFIPQQIPKGAEDVAACMGAIEDMVELGRNVGIGVALVTQRSARMNKSVSELCEMMVAFRTVGPNSIDAIIDWFGEHVPKARQKELIEEIRQLPVGRALVVSPGWLGIEGAYDIRMRTTFDSSSTPKAGTEHRTTGRGAEVDREKYVARMAEVAEAAKSVNPDELRREVARLKRDLEKARKAAPAPATEIVIEEKEVPAIPAGVVERVAKLVDLAGDVYSAVLAFDEQVDALGHDVEKLRRIEDWANARGAGSGTPRAAIRSRTGPSSRSATVGARSPRPAKPAPERAQQRGDGALPSGERRVLVAIAQNAAGITPEALSLLTGYKRRTRNDYVQRLSAAGYAERNARSGRIVATDVGVDALGDDYETLPTGAELRDYWLGRLPAGEAAVLSVLIEAYPDGVSRDEVSERTGYAVRTRNDYLQRLKSRELIRTSGSTVYASDVLFEEG